MSTARYLVGDVFERMAELPDGSGTTLAVATGLGRDAIGIDIDQRNLDLARERVGMFLIEEESTTVDVAL